MTSGLSSLQSRHPVALFLATLALLAQMAFGPVALRDAVAFTPSDPGICHAPGDPAAPAQHGMDCTLCVVCHALGAAAVLPTPATGQHVPRTIATRLEAAELASHAIGAPIFASIYPTGPPALD